MNVYNGIFEAKVIHEGKCLPNSEFRFGIKGEGTLPSLRVINIEN